MRYDTYLKAEQLVESFRTYGPFPIVEELEFKAHFEDIASNMELCTPRLETTDIVISDMVRN